MSTDFTIRQLLENLAQSAHWHQAHCQDESCAVSLLGLKQLAEAVAAEFIGYGDERGVDAPTRALIDGMPS